MSYNRPYGSNYYEEEREVVREGPYGTYSAEYRVDEYGNRMPHHHNRHNGMGGVVGEIVGEISGGHHHHGRPTEVIERREEYIVDNNAYDPYRRMY